MRTLSQDDNSKDFWSYISGSRQFSSSKVYKSLIGVVTVHSVFSWLWASKCQPKHKFFFWLLLQNRLNTRGMLKRRHMALDSFTCENCILQHEEILEHLFLRCSFAKACWNSIGLFAPRTHCPQRAVVRLKRQLRLPCAMEVIILMAWSIWKCRNDWIFENIPPTVQNCRAFFKQEMLLVIHRARSRFKDVILQWLDQLML